MTQGEHSKQHGLEITGLHREGDTFRLQAPLTYFSSQGFSQPAANQPAPRTTRHSWFLSSSFHTAQLLPGAVPKFLEGPTELPLSLVSLPELFPLSHHRFLDRPVSEPSATVTGPAMPQSTMGDRARLCFEASKYEGGRIEADSCACPKEPWTPSFVCTGALHSKTQLSYCTYVSSTPPGPGRWPEGCYHSPGSASCSEGNQESFP